jgi:hypothetical protein
VNIERYGTLQPLIATVDESYFLSVKMALDAHGIRHSDYQNQAEGPANMANCVMVAPADFTRATAVIAGLQETSPYAGMWDNKLFRIIAILMAVAFVAAIATNLLWAH